MRQNFSQCSVADISRYDEHSSLRRVIICGKLHILQMNLCLFYFSMKLSLSVSFLLIFGISIFVLNFIIFDFNYTFIFSYFLFDFSCNFLFLFKFDLGALFIRLILFKKSYLVLFKTSIPVLPENSQTNPRVSRKGEKVKGIFKDQSIASLQVQ